MLGYFSNVNNSYGFEIRKITFIEGRRHPRIQPQNIAELLPIISELQHFKCKKDCKSKIEYYNQFKKIGDNPQQLGI